MKQINGKTLIWSDFHLGLASNKESRLRICEEVMDRMLARIDAEKITTSICGGDIFHNRVSIDSNTLNVAYRLIEKLANKTRTIIILGNHDLYLKNSVDISSVNIFKDIPNVEIVSKFEEVDINGFKTALVPWLADLTQYGKNTYDFMVGHFDISSRYLIQSYIEEHAGEKTADQDTVAKIEKTVKSKAGKAADQVGDFVELAKKNGAIFAGHIHTHKEFRSKGRNFIFIGSPYQQNLGDAGTERGFYVLNEDGSYKFIEIDDVPKHVKLHMSDVMREGVDKFDFSAVKNNIVQKIYDVEVKIDDEIEISRKIRDFGPYEELIPEYAVKISDSGSRSAEEKTSIELIKKSKLEYIRNYVDHIDEKALNGEGVEREKLFGVLEEYYKKVTV